ncbi:MAG: [LysW]-lysine hydrolase [Anaerolineales bacterium]|nr:[LysW]-lysine hydrolase [Anaerolineales bacterium]
MEPFDFSTIIGLVSQYSPSGQERGAVEWLAARMQALGFSRAFVDGAGNAVGVMGDGARQVVLLGHIDTVPGEIQVETKDGILFGRGSVDAKGPLACFTDGVARVGAVEGWQFVVIGAVEEERNSEGARFVAPSYQPEFAIIGEPNRWDRVALGYKGSAWAQITVRRAQAHSASGQESACEGAVNVWNRTKAWVETFNEGRGKVFDQVLLSLRALRSGQEGFENWAQIQIGARLPVSVSPDDWYQILNEMVGDGELERTGYAIPAYQCEKNTALVRAFLSGIRAEGGKPSFVYKTGTADLNIVGPVWNCPALVYGPGDSALDHTPEEHIELDEYAKAVEVLAGALRALVG